MRQRDHMQRENAYQTPFSVPDYYLKPMDIIRGRMVEAPYNVKSSMDFLQEYEAETRAMKKAKSFLMKFQKYNANPETREAKRQQYRVEIDALRARVWKFHIMNKAANGITFMYNYQPRVPVALPEEFQNLSYYAVLQPVDCRNSNLFRVIQHYIEACKGHNLQQPLGRDLGEIQNRYPKESEELKKLLWERHLAKKEQDDARNEVFERMSEESNRKRKIESLISVSTIIAAAASVIFLILACTINPFLAIPTASFFIASVAIPIIFNFWGTK